MAEETIPSPKTSTLTKKPRKKNSSLHNLDSAHPPPLVSESARSSKFLTFLSDHLSSKSSLVWRKDGRVKNKSQRKTGSLLNKEIFCPAALLYIFLVYFAQSCSASPQFRFPEDFYSSQSSRSAMSPRIPTGAWNFPSTESRTIQSGYSGHRPQFSNSNVKHETFIVEPITHQDDDHSPYTPISSANFAPSWGGGKSVGSGGPSWGERPRYRGNLPDELKKLTPRQLEAFFDALAENRTRYGRDSPDIYGEGTESKFCQFVHFCAQQAVKG